jgi:hypothetical protein
MFANSPQIAEPRRIFSGRRTRAPHFVLRLVVAMTAICAAGYALASGLII